MAVAIGRMKEFNPDQETVTAYLERFKLYVEVNDIEDAKKVPILLTVMGAKHYSLIQGLVAPALPREKTLAELETLLKKHYDPEPIVIAQRFHFYQGSQKPGESIADYQASLRKLASHCKFGAFLAEALRDRLVCGLLSDAIQKALLSKADLTLETAIEVAQGMEAAAKKAKDMRGTSRTNPVMSVEADRKCFRCGRGNHRESECRYRTAKCHKCGKVGHIAPVCKAKKERPPPKGNPPAQPQGTHHVTSNEPENTRPL